MVAKGGTVGRKPILDEQGRKRSELPSSQRGFGPVTLGKEAQAKLAAYMVKHGIVKKATAVEHLLDHIDRQAPATPPQTAPAIPWDELEAAFLEEFGFKDRLRVEKAIAKLKAARE